MSGGSMTIKGELTCECHVKEYEPGVPYKSKEGERAFCEWHLSPPSFNLIIPLCFGNTAAALVLIIKLLN